VGERAAMTTSDDDGRGGDRYKRLAGAIAAATGLLAIAVTATVVVGGAQLVGSPMATAGTTKATPWVPHPAFIGKPVGKAPTVAAQGTPVDKDAQALSGWVNKAAAPFKAISDSMNALGKSLDNNDPAAMRRACNQLASAGGEFGKTLPSPNADVTTAGQAAVNEITAASAACLADPPDIEGLTSHATEANNQLATVAKIASGG
jgi:hypothetical protein